MGASMIPCKDCGADLQAVGFYSSRPNVCRACVCRRQREVRAARLEYYRAYDRARGDRADRVAARRAYQATPEGKERMRAGSQAWVQRNADKKAAHTVVGNAIRDGRLSRPDRCGICFKRCTPHAHHDDYSKPLDVRWLCHGCHSLWHKTQRAQARNSQDGRHG